MSKNKEKKFFKGFYFKHQKDDDVVSFIVGKTSSEKFIQVITDDESYVIPFIGNNIFSSRGINVNIKYGEVSIIGKIKYSNLTPIKYDIMGPFKYFPMECRHIIVSMKHDLMGSIAINNKIMDFSGGTGYIEGDSGMSFPKSYTWIQCNDFKCDLSIVASVADIPFYCCQFKGCICVIMYCGREYRLATYLGAKIIKCDQDEMILVQREYMLQINMTRNNSQKLKSPFKGRMSGNILESVSTHARFRFYKNNKILFDLQSEHASVE